MQKILTQIEEAIQGDLTTKQNYLDYYSTDGSIFELTPTAICFPKDSVDIQNIVTIIHDAAKQGHYLPITPRGKGTDQGGGPLGTGLIMDFTRYMNQILEIGDDYVRVQPGVRYGELQDALKKRGRYLPPYPASLEICSIGGAVANNSAGEKTVKYGATRHYVKNLHVVLSNGDMIQTEKLTRRQLGVRKRQDSFLGKIYKQIHTIITDNEDVIDTHRPHVTKNSSGYALWEIEKWGMFDLAQLITGSQGTLGIVTEIILETMPLPESSDVVLAVSHYDSLQAAGNAIRELHELEPSALEVVDQNLLKLVLKQNPTLLDGLLPKELPAIILLTEFDNDSKNETAKKMASAVSTFDKYAFSWVKKEDPAEQARLWKLRRSAAAVMWTIPGSKKALP
ncbi:FAD-binding oxidoreductase, partial [candidate division WWE3 bacterium]|nr:FAD-binding oxidoreductase [candidate division WWE3 bacterium]